MDFLKIGESWWLTAAVYVPIIAVAAVVLYQRQPILKFVGEVKVELAKCTWPWNPEQTGLRRYKELIDATVVVAVTTLLLAAYVAIFDFLLGHLAAWLVKF